MIREWVDHLLLHQSPDAKALGYGKEVVAIQARYRRNRQAWKPHLQNSRDAILKAANKIKHRRCCVVHGSGALLDVPLDGLASQFDQVLLVDRVHPKTAVRAERRLDNVALIEADLLDPNTWPQVTADLTISLNVLSQLPLIPLRTCTIDKATFAQKILDDYLLRLRGLNGVVCMITDVWRSWYGLSGNLMNNENSLWGLNLPEPTMSWAWDIAPAPEINPTASLSLTVYAYEDLSSIWTVAAP